MVPPTTPPLYPLLFTELPATQSHAYGQQGNASANMMPGSMCGLGSISGKTSAKAVMRPLYLASRTAVFRGLVLLPPREEVI